MDDIRLGKLNGEFVVYVGRGAERSRYKTGARNAKDAEAWKRDFIRKRERAAADGKALRIEQMWSDYISDRTAEGKSSVPRMQDAWKSLAPHFGHLTLADLMDGEEVRGYTAKRRKAGRSDGTIHTELGYLRSAIRVSAERRGVETIPKITLPSKPRPRGRYLTTEEYHRLIQAAVMPHLRLFIMLSVFTAGRPSSILDLTWDRVDFKRRQIALDNPERDRTAKGRALVPMAEELVSPLLEAKSGAQTEYVIEWAGKPVKSIKKGVQRAAERAGLKNVTPYVLRHTAGVWLAEGGTPMSEISQYLGHTSTAVTERTYARYSPDHLRSGAMVIGERIKR